MGNTSQTAPHTVVLDRIHKQRFFASSPPLLLLTLLPLKFSCSVLSSLPFIVILILPSLNLHSACRRESCFLVAHVIQLELIPMMTNFLMDELTSIIMPPFFSLRSTGTDFLCPYFFLPMR